MIKLPRLAPNWNKQPGLFERYWDKAMSQLEENLNAILAIPDIAAAVAAAQSAANAANTAAANAQSAADSTSSKISLVNSYVDTTSYTAPLISADSSGNITIKTHTRIYGNSTLNPSVSVTGATITTTAVTGKVVRIYYDDASRAGGAVSYLYTIDPAAAPVQTGSTHSVGVVTIPASGTNNGAEIKAPGYVYTP